MTKENIRYIIDKSFTKLLFPTLAGNIAIVLVSLADVALTSHFYGANGLAVVSLFIPLLTLWGCIYEGIGTGAASLLAQNIGADTPQKGYDITAKSNSITLLLSLIIAVTGISASFFISASSLGVAEPLFNDALWYGRIMLITTLPLVLNNYFLFLVRTDSAPKVAAISNGIQVILNIALDIIFMGVMDLGIKGAALALLIASYIAFSVTLIHLYSRRSSIKLVFKRPDWKTLKVVIPYSFNSISDNLADFVVSLFVNVSTLVVFGIKIASIIYIINYITIFVIYCGMGFTYSVIPIIGVYFGEKNNWAINYVAHKGFRYAGVAGIIIALFIAIFAHPISIGIFNFEYPDLYDLCNRAIMMYALSIPLYMLNIMMICYCQQTNKLRLSFLLTTMSSTITLLVLATFTILANADYLWWYSLIAESVVLIWWTLYTNNKKRKMNADSFLCLPKYESPYKAETNYLLLPDKFEEVENCQDIAKTFLSDRHIKENYINKAVLSIEEIMNFAMATKCSKHGYIDIRLAITKDERVCITAKMDNSIIDINSILKTDLLSPDCLLSLHVLRSLASDFKYNRVLSFNTINLRI